MNKVKNIKLLFSNRLRKFLLIGLAVFMLAFATQQILVGNVFQRGPSRALAQYWDEGSTDGFVPVPEITSEPAPTEPEWDGGSTDGFVPIPEITTQPAPFEPAPVQPASQEGPTLTYAGGDCEGNRSVWVHIFSDGRRVIQADHGVVPGECGNTIEQPVPQSVSQSAPQTFRTIQQVSGTPQQTFVTDNSVRNTTRNTTRTDSHDRTIIDDHSIRGSFNDSHNDSHNITTTRTVEKEVVREVPVTRVVTTQGDVTCPSGTTKIIDGSSITCVLLPTTTRVVTAQAAPQVVTVAGSDTKELPKTGLPLAGLALGALAPLGLRLKRFGAQSSSPQAHDGIANFVWEQRQLSRN